MNPTIRSLVHAAGFVGALLILWCVVTLGHLDRWGFAKNAVLNVGEHTLLVDIGIAIIMAVSLNLILGIAGQFSLGHAGFQAAGAFTAVLISGRYFEPLLVFFTQRCHWSAEFSFQAIMVLGMAAGALVAAALGLLVGLPTLRLRGDYLAIATLGFGEILFLIFQNVSWNGEPFFGGPRGLSLFAMQTEWVRDRSVDEVPSTPLAALVKAHNEQREYSLGLFATFAVVLLTVYLVRNIKNATAGRALLALREDAVAAESVGVPTTRNKVTAFVMGAALAGLAGGLFAHHKDVNPESFRFMHSIEIVAMVILGGQGSITGSILAAILLTLMPEALRSYVMPWMAQGLSLVHWKEAADWAAHFDIEKWRMVLYSLFIILAMLFRPQGLMGRYEIGDVFNWVFRRRKDRRGGDETAVPAGVVTLTAEREMVLSTDGRMVLVEARNVTMQFGGLKAVDAFSLTLHAGELVGLIGPNGAGKTTVFNVLTGVYRPTAGGVEVRGGVMGAAGAREAAGPMRSIVRLKPHGISKLGVARTFQNIRLFGNLSVLDNVLIAQHAHHKQGMPSAIVRWPAFYREEETSRRQAMGYLGLFNLAHLAEERANALSYGDQRRLEIARALATRPRVLLLDEPAAGMNPTEKRELMEMIRGLRSRFGLTVLLIEHDMKVIMGVCERIVVLDYGRTIASGTPEAIRRDPAVIAAYLGKSHE